MRIGNVALVVLVLAVGGLMPAGARGARGGMKTVKDDRGAPPEVKAAMAELWRRGTCLLSSVLKPAARDSVVPGDVGTTPVVTPRLFSRRGAILAYAADGATLWAADDQALYQADAAAGKLIRRFGRPEGLPDELIVSIAPAGDSVHLATRTGLARLDVKAGRIRPVPDIRFTIGLLAAGGGAAWLVSDAGAYHLPPGQADWQALGEFPGQKQLAAVAGRGFWWPTWRNHVRTLISDAFANADGLYVICLNRLLRYDPSAGKWKTLCEQAWQARASGRTVWALTTAGVARYDGAADKTQPFRSGAGPAPGRPVAMAAAERTLFLATEPDYDARAERFVGGGISQLDLASGKWTITDTVDGQDVRFTSAVVAAKDEAWAACTLYDKVVQLGAHPGMAHVTRWRPHACGLGLLHWRGGSWTLAKPDLPAGEKRWVLGQKGTVDADVIRPETVPSLHCCAGRLWGTYHMFPQHYYAGYYVSVGCLGIRDSQTWTARCDVRTEELGLAGEQPELLLISHSHGHRIVLAEGHPVVLGIEELAGRTWAICESGLFVHDADADKFTPVVREDFRLYWRATAAATGPRALWFGGDGGTVSRLDRRTGQIELVGVAPRRKVVAVACDDGRVFVRTARTNVSLPVSLRGAVKLPDADAIVFDGKGWSASDDKAGPPGPKRTCETKGNYVWRGKQRVAFLRGVFKPSVLCEDAGAGKLWLATYEGVASIPLPGAE